MKIETIPQEDHQVKIEAEFEDELFESFKRRAARKIAKQAKIPGFRPGKAPYDVVLRMYGEGVINEEAVELLIDEQYAKVLDEATIEPSGPGALKEIVSMEPLKLSFMVPLKPEIVLGDYKEIQLEYTPEAVSEDEITEFLARLQKNYATAEPVDRAIEKGDLVYFKLKGLANEETILEELPVQFVVGDDQQKDNWPFENFSNELIGLKESEDKEIEHTFGEENEDDRFKGKTIKFVVNVQSVKTLSLPELNDDFAKLLGQFEDYAALEKAVRDQQESNKKQEYDEKYFSELISKYAEQATVKFPPFMVDEEIEQMFKSLERDLKQQNLDVETYLKLLKKEKEEYIEENVRPAAINRVKNSLIIEKFAQEEKVEVPKKDIDGIINDTVQMLHNMPDQKGKKAKVTNEMVNNVAYNAISRLYNQRTLEKMKALATGELLLEETQEAVKEVEEGVEGESEVVIEEKLEVVSTETQEIIETSIAEEVEDDTEVVVEEKLEVESSETKDLPENEGEENPKE
ncbi:MAG: trigger factor [Anaerolineaceae bacterium]|nr:trigger factor [Anaerolineaceae bacterium]